MAKMRRDINAVLQNPGEFDNYIHALNIVRKRSQINPDDPAGYDFQAARHNDPLVGPCQHGSDLFLPWHRAHLIYFEKLLQATDPPRTANATISYWDWIHPETDGRKFPRAFELPGLSMSGRNPNALPLPPDTLDIVTTETDWNKFAGYPLGDPRGDYGRLEYGPHNYMHPNFIGGKMASTTTAAEDAIYWSFHCFIDLLWVEWRRRNPNAVISSLDAGLKRAFENQPLNHVRDFQNTLDLDYAYEYNTALNHDFGIAPQAPVSRVLMEERALQPLFAGRIESELTAKSTIQFAVLKPPAAATAALIRLQDLKVPITGSYLIKAFLHPQDVPYVRGNEGFERRYGAGYVALWQAHTSPDTEVGGHGGAHGHHGGPEPMPHHPATCTARFDITRALKSADHSKDLILTLLYIPSPDPSGAPRPFSEELVREVQLKDVLLEVYR